MDRSERLARQHPSRRSDSYVSYTYLDDTQRVELTMPDQPGNYELRYVFRDREVIATRPIRVVAKP